MISLGVVEVHVTNMKFLIISLKSFYLLIKQKTVRLGSVLKYSSNVVKVLELKSSVNTKSLIIYQYFYTKIFQVISRINL